MTHVTLINGISFQEFERECNRVLTNIAGLGIHDLADATWRDYYDDGMTPRSAIECANDDFWTFSKSVNQIGKAHKKSFAFFFI